jgi:hypothetical protein
MQKHAYQLQYRAEALAKYQPARRALLDAINAVQESTDPVTVVGDSKNQFILCFEMVTNSDVCSPRSLCCRNASQSSPSGLKESPVHTGFLHYFERSRRRMGPILQGSVTRAPQGRDH